MKKQATPTAHKFPPVAAECGGVPLQACEERAAPERGKNGGAGDKGGEVEDHHGAERVGQAVHGVGNIDNAEELEMERDQDEDDGGKQSGEEERAEKKRMAEVRDAAEIGWGSGRG